MIEKIEGNYPKAEMGIKRLYLHGVKLHCKCPKCKNLVIHNMSEDSLYYPDMNKPIEIYFYCQKCENEWNEKIILKVGVETLLEEDPEIQKLVKEAFFK